jgi:hypothetical protein
MKKIRILAVIILALGARSVTAQSLIRFAPRVGVGASRGLIVEGAAALWFCSYGNGGRSNGIFNTQIISPYCGAEVNYTLRRSPVYAWKIGLESISVGHVTSYGGAEYLRYTIDTVSCGALNIRTGLPLMYGALYLGYSFYGKKIIKQQVGSFRIGLTLGYDSKTSRIFSKGISDSKDHDL